MKKNFFLSMGIGLSLLIGSYIVPTQVGAHAHTSKPISNIMKMPDGLQYKDIVTGKGAMPKLDDTVTVSYVGTLTDGKKFDASADHGGSFTFPLGQGQVIKGWDEGVASMRVGGERRLIIPPDLGYGAQGAGNAIPPNATLIFDVKLLKIGT